MARGRLRGFRADRLRAARTAAGLTQEMLAIRAGLSRGTVTHWESGRSAPDPRSALRVGEVLGVAVRDLTAITSAEAEPADFRAWAGFTRPLVNAATGIPEEALGQIERFVARPSPAAAAELGALFGVEPATYLSAWERGRALASAFQRPHQTPRPPSP